MTKTKALTVTPDRWNMLLSIAKEMYESRAFGVTRGEAAIKLLFCLEYGLPLSAANQGLFVVNQRISAMGQICAAALKNHPDYNYFIEHLDDKGCTIAVFEHGEKIGTASFMEKDAKRAELLSKDVWKKYPEDMYFNRAIGRAMRRHAPNALSMTVYTPEELGAEVNQDSEASAWSIADPASFSVEPIGTSPDVATYIPFPTKQSVPTYDSIEKLLAQLGWTAERIIAANEGKIPATAEECQKVAEKLEAEDA